MRKTVLTGVLIVLLAVPVLAQFQFGRGMFGGGLDATALLGNPDVQKALKLTEEQTKAITEATTARNEAIKSAFADMDREAVTKATETFTKAMGKVKDALKPEQLKRLGQLEIQAAIQNNQPTIFNRAEVQKALNLSDKQKEMIKETLGNLEKDGKELAEDAKGDFGKIKEMMTKMQAINKEAFTKIAKGMSEDQQRVWKDLQGEKFDGKLGGFGKGGFGGKKKKDDF